MKADRLLSALLLLQARGRVTGREMAERLEVSGRTVHRDMEALSAAGVPVFAVRGSRGGWQLDEDWRTQVPGLDETELRALLMAQPRVLGDPRLVAAAESAFSKLMASLPVSLRAQANAIRQRLHIDTTGWRGLSETVDSLPVVQEAVARDRQLSFRYRKRHGELSARIVDPLGLVAKGSAWYLVARTSEGFRTFRVSRMEDPVLLETASTRPHRFDLGAYWRRSTHEFLEGRNTYAATLRVERSAAERLSMWRFQSQRAASSASRRGVGESGKSGWVTMELDFDDEEQACFVVLGFASRAEVIAPVALRERVRQELLRAVSLSEPPRSVPGTVPRPRARSGRSRLLRPKE